MCSLRERTAAAAAAVLAGAALVSPRAEGLGGPGLIPWRISARRIGIWLFILLTISEPNVVQRAERARPGRNFPPCPQSLWFYI
jgi:hypothetical protein